MASDHHSRRRRVQGRLRVSRRGFGFVVVDQPPDQPDVFIPARRLAGAFDGDLVEVVVDARRSSRRHPDRGPRGRVERVLERTSQTLIGRIVSGEPTYFVSRDPRHPPIVLASGQHVPHGVIVAARLTDRQQPRASIISVLGREDDPDLPVLAACARHGIRPEFDEEVLQAASRCRRPDEADYAGRRDLRGRITFTIDGADARDFDDAVSIEALEQGGWRLGVHIADVAHYVPAGGPIDEEAFQRATSVYFPDRAVPMLPERLSSDLCSLRPDTDRLTVSVEIEFDGRGAAGKVEFFESVIHSHARLTYERAEELTSDGPPAGGAESDVVESLQAMLKLAARLRQRRLDRGAIDLDIAEAEAVLTPDGEVETFRRRARLPAHQLIEEFMLAANEAVATHLAGADGGMVFRVHPRPEEERLLAFQSVAAHFGLFLGRAEASRLQGSDFQIFLDRIRNEPQLDFLAGLLLRSFERAYYSVENVGHFGLAAPCYTHFTSPIRRYPDLIVHRLLKARLQASSASGAEGRLEPAVRHCSERERAAVDAEREVMRVLMARWMEERLGEEFAAVITAVGRWGFEVQLPALLIEGRVSRDSFPERMRFYEDRMRLVGRHRSFQIGDRVRVQAISSDTDLGRIEFEAV